mgnify:FL=1
MDEKRLEELFSNQEFVNALGAADKAEEVVRIFAEHDVEVSKEDAEAFLAVRDKAPEGELSEDALDGVAGGITWRLLWHVWKTMGSSLGGPIRPWMR